MTIAPMTKDDSPTVTVLAKYSELRDHQIADIRNLVLSVFHQFEAPECSEEGVREFEKYIAHDAFLARRHDHVVLVCEVDGTIAGMIEIRRWQHVSLMFVDSRFHRRGIARNLWQHARVKCVAQNPTLEGITVNSSRFAVPVYERFGFVATTSEQILNGIRFTPMVFEIQRSQGE
jgi:GNAT superfamily N-acetyltransferase